MSWFGLFDKKKRHTFTDEDREVSTAKRRLHKQEIEQEREKKELKWELEKIELMHRINELKGDSGEDDLDTQIVNIIGMGMQVKQQQAQAPKIDTNGKVVEMTDQEIRDLVADFPERQVKMFRKLPIPLQRMKIQEKFPEVGQDTINRAITIISKL